MPFYGGDHYSAFQTYIKIIRSSFIFLIFQNNSVSLKLGSFMLQSFSYHFQRFFFLFQFKCSHYSKQEKLNMYIASGTCNFIDCLKSKIDLRFGGKLENEHLMGKFRDITPTLVYTDAFEFWNFQMICQSLSYSTDTDGGTQVGHQFLHVASPCGLIFLTARWLRAPRVSQPMRWKLCCLLLCSLRTKVASLLFFFQ